MKFHLARFITTLAFLATTISSHASSPECIFIINKIKGRDKPFVHHQFDINTQSRVEWSRFDDLVKSEIVRVTQKFDIEAIPLEAQNLALKNGLKDWASNAQSLDNSLEDTLVIGYLVIRNAKSNLVKLEASYELLSYSYPLYIFTRGAQNLAQAKNVSRSILDTSLVRELENTIPGLGEVSLGDMTPSLDNMLGGQISDLILRPSNDRLDAYFNNLLRNAYDENLESVGVDGPIPYLLMNRFMLEAKAGALDIQTIQLIEQLLKNSKDPMNLAFANKILSTSKFKPKGSHLGQLDLNRLMNDFLNKNFRTEQDVTSGGLEKYEILVENYKKWRLLGFDRGTAPIVEVLVKNGALESSVRLINAWDADAIFDLSDSAMLSLANHAMSRLNELASTGRLEAGWEKSADLSLVSTYFDVSQTVLRAFDEKGFALENQNFLAGLKKISEKESSTPNGYFIDKLNELMADHGQRPSVDGGFMRGGLLDD
jgi:hypothetical protein